MKLVRLNVNLNMGSAAALKELADEQGTTFTETVRRAISTYYYLIQHRRDGWTITLTNHATQEKKDMVLL